MKDFSDKETVSRNHIFKASHSLGINFALFPEPCEGWVYPQVNDFEFQRTGVLNIE